MMTSLNLRLKTPMISKQAFKKIQALFRQQSGIFIAEHKEQLIITRLNSHMQSLGFTNFDEYCDFLGNDNAERERKEVVDLLTTNETYFFREPDHFANLTNLILPSIKNRPVRVWSAAASSGEEPYSLAMTLSESLGLQEWNLVASDISNRVLERAQFGLYGMQRLDHMPPQYLRKYCRKGIAEYNGMFRINQELRERVHFTHHNLLESAAHLGQFDIIFVRNVLIYFDHAVKRQVLQNLFNQLRPGGWLITSHAESLLGTELPLKVIKPSIYRKSDL